MARKRSNRLPKRQPIHVLYDFSEPPPQYVPPVVPKPPTAEEVEGMDLQQMCTLLIQLGEDPKVVYGITKCADGGRHKPIQHNNMSAYKVCCLGGPRVPECAACPDPDGPRAPKYGVDLFWCRECFQWVLV